MQNSIPNHQSGVNTRPGPGVTGSSGSQQACAACKYQRRKCAPNCLLAKHFPPNHQKQFLNAHRLFGVCNISRFLKELDPPEQEIAAKTMIFEATVRANDPVGGCHRIITQLLRQINNSKAELELVLQQLAILRPKSESTQNPNLPLTEAMHGQRVINVDPLTLHNIHNSMPREEGYLQNIMPEEGSIIKVDPEGYLHNIMLEEGSVIKFDPEGYLQNIMAEEGSLIKVDPEGYLQNIMAEEGSIIKVDPEGYLHNIMSDNIMPEEGSIIKVDPEGYLHNIMPEEGSVIKVDPEVSLHHSSMNFENFDSEVSSSYLHDNHDEFRDIKPENQ